MLEQRTYPKVAMCINSFVDFSYCGFVKNVVSSRRNEGLAVAGEVLMSISKDEREKAIFRSRRIALADQESNRVTAERNHKIALANAEKENTITIAKNLLQMNLPIEQIVKGTGLTRGEVEALRDADK